MSRRHEAVGGKLHGSFFFFLFFCGNFSRNSCVMYFIISMKGICVVVVVAVPNGSFICNWYVL